MKRNLLKRSIAASLLVGVMAVGTGCGSEYGELEKPSKVPDTVQYETRKSTMSDLIGGITPEKDAYINYYFDLQFSLPPGWHFTTDLKAMGTSKFIDVARTDELLATKNRYYTMAARGEDALVCIWIFNRSAAGLGNLTDDELLSYSYNWEISDLGSKEHRSIRPNVTVPIAGKEVNGFYYTIDAYSDGGTGKYEVEFITMRRDDLVLAIWLESSAKVSIEQIESLFSYYNGEEKK